VARIPSADSAAEAVGQITPDSDFVPPPPSSADGRKPANLKPLGRLVRKRLAAFIEVTQKLIDSDDPETVHDVRVCSRRLQQGLSVLFPKPRPGKVLKFRHTLRGIRKLLGEWRNCDVLIELAQRRVSRAGSAAKKKGWETVRDHLRRKRRDQIETAREKLSRFRLQEASGNLKKWFASRDVDQDPEPLGSSLKGSIARAWSDWESALARARATQATDDIHQFRIAAKRLRYRLELLHDLGEKDIKPSLKFLKRLQNELGDWHDCQALFEAAAGAIARPEILLHNSDAARILLKEIDTGRLRQRKRTGKIFELAEQRSGTEQNSAQRGSEPVVSSST
jgi:CHAD domain-containing protein